MSLSKEEDGSRVLFRKFTLLDTAINLKSSRTIFWKLYQCSLTISLLNIESFLFEIIKELFSLVKMVKTLIKLLSVEVECS